MHFHVTAPNGDDLEPAPGEGGLAIERVLHRGDGGPRERASPVVAGQLFAQGLQTPPVDSPDGPPKQESGKEPQGEAGDDRAQG